MKSSIIVGGIVVVIILLGGWLLIKSNPSTETLTPTPLATDQAFASPDVTADMTSTSPSPSVSPSVSPTPQAKGATVTITDAGFSPSTITVKPGTTVTFVNDGQGPHWPASNPHPTHTDLPGFDAKHALATGETYSFVFQKIGQWGYHDHLNPSTMGVVIVQP